MTPSASPSRSVSAILGFLLKGEVDAAFRQLPFEVSGNRPNPFDLWRESCDAIRGLAPTPIRHEITLIDANKSPIVSEIKSRPTFTRFYEAVDDYQFALVPIHCLLSPQWFADVDYIDELSAQVSETSTLEELLHLTMADGRVTRPIVSGCQVVFNSFRPDLHADQVPTVREVGPGAFEIVVSAGCRPNYVQVVAIGNRLMLTNGVHRVCALFKRGHLMTPCLLRKVSRIEEAGLNLQTTLFRPELMNGPRPAQVIDFLTDGVAAKLKMRSVQHVLRVAVGVEVIQAPTGQSMLTTTKGQPEPHEPNPETFRPMANGRSTPAF